MSEPSRGYLSVPWTPPANLVPLDPVRPVDFRAHLGRPLRVRWEGDVSFLFSLARVNREYCLGLLSAGDVELSLGERQTRWHTLTERDDPRFGPLFARRGAELSGPPDVTVCHPFHRHGGQREVGKLVGIQPWEYGHLPRRWAQALREKPEEVWVHSRFVRDASIRSGVPAEKVCIVPLGFHPGVFTPDGSPYPLPTEKRVRFLFVGGTLARKGADLLLGAYRRAFTAADDVCLVVKDMGTRTVYEGQTLAEAFRRAAADPRGPEVIYLDDDLSDPELASLYRTCSCAVLPYRAEGFALAALEGMACGLPTIVTAGGPTDDYLGDTHGWRLPAQRCSSGSWNLGSYTCVGDPWQLEPDRESLVEAMQQVYHHPEEARRRGDAAQAHAQAGWTWAHAVALARARLLDMVVRPWERPIVPAKPWATPAGKGHRSGAKKGCHARVKKGGETTVAMWSELTPESPPLSPTLSVCMIVRDEEPRLPKCLKSIAPYVDEIVVVDTGSKDQTREMAAAFGARVFDFPWVDSFSEARNQSLAQARGDWVMRMDADDEISPEDGQRLRELIGSHPNRDVAFLVQYRVPPGPEGNGEHVRDQLQLWPNRPDIRFEFRDHEQSLPSVQRAGLSVVHSGISILHKNYDWSPEGQDQRRRRHARLLELDLRENPDHPYVLLNLGISCLHETRDYEVAAHYLRRSLDCPHGWQSTARLAYAMLVTARSAQADWTTAVAVNEEGRRYYADDAQLLLQAGQLYQQLGRWEDARRVLERLVLGYDEPVYRCGETGLRTYRGRHELALLLWRLGQIRHAEQILQEIAVTYPTYLPAQLHQSEALLALGQTEEARQLLARIPAATGIEAELLRLRARVGASG